MELETIGENAGKVWRTLNEMRGEISIQELSRKINLQRRRRCTCGRLVSQRK